MTEQVFWVRYLNAGGAMRRRFVSLGTHDEATARLLLERQYAAVVVDLWRGPAWLSMGWQAVRPLFSRAWPVQDLTDLLHNLGIMLKSGLPIDLALSELLKDTTHPGVRQCVRDIYNSVSAGNSLSSALARYEHQVPLAVHALVVLGEQSGGLDHTLQEAARHLKRMQTIRQDIGKALIYPLFACSTILIALLFWIYYVLPDLARMFQQMGAKLPSYTLWTMNFIMQMQSFMRSGFWFAAAAVSVGLSLALRNRGVRYRLYHLFYRLPISGLIMRTGALAFITEYLALLIRAGLPLTEALRILTDAMRNPYFSAKLVSIREGVARGHSLSQEMTRSGVFPSMVTRLVAVGEQSGTLDNQLALLAADYQQRLAHVIATLSEIIKPLLVVVAGLFFALIVIVFLMPVYQLIAQVMR